MASPVDLWHAEHRDFERLLGLVDAEIKVFRDGGTPDYDLMRDIVRYLRHFPDRYHHPREDVAYSRLASRDPAIGELARELQQEHRVIGTAGDAMLKCLDEIAGDALVPRAALEAAAATYLVYYRKHIEREDARILPVAANLLTQEDWDAVAAARPAGADPLFGPEADPRFRELRRLISSGTRGA